MGMNSLKNLSLGLAVVAASLSAPDKSKAKSPDHPVDKGRATASLSINETLSKSEELTPDGPPKRTSIKIPKKGQGKPKDQVQPGAKHPPKPGETAKTPSATPETRKLRILREQYEAAQRRHDEIMNRMFRLGDKADALAERYIKLLEQGKDLWDPDAADDAKLKSFSNELDASFNGSIADRKKVLDMFPALDRARDKMMRAKRAYEAAKPKPPKKPQKPGTQPPKQPDKKIPKKPIVPVDDRRMPMT